MSPETPARTRTGDLFGRGLHIVNLLAVRWAVDRRVVGKTIWAELELPGSHGA